MAKEYQKSSGTAQSLDERVQQMRGKLLEYQEAVEEQEEKIKELKLRYGKFYLDSTKLHSVFFIRTFFIRTLRLRLTKILRTY